jgi:hypothetical protein
MSYFSRMCCFEFIYLIRNRVCSEWDEAVWVFLGHTTNTPWIACRHHCWRWPGSPVHRLVSSSLSSETTQWPCWCPTSMRSKAEDKYRKELLVFSAGDRRTRGDIYVVAARSCCTSTNERTHVRPSSQWVRGLERSWSQPWCLQVVLACLAPDHRHTLLPSCRRSSLPKRYTTTHLCRRQSVRKDDLLPSKKQCINLYLTPSLSNDITYRSCLICKSTPLVFRFSGPTEWTLYLERNLLSGTANSSFVSMLQWTLMLYF